MSLQGCVPCCCHVGGITELACARGLVDGEAVGLFLRGEVGFAEIPFDLGGGGRLERKIREEEGQTA